MITDRFLNDKYLMEKVVIISIDQTNILFSVGNLSHHVNNIIDRNRWSREGYKTANDHAKNGNKYGRDRMLSKIHNYNQRTVESIDDLFRYLPSIDARISWEEFDFPEIIPPKPVVKMPASHYYSTTTMSSTSTITPTITFKTSGYVMDPNDYLIQRDLPVVPDALVFPDAEEEG